MPGRLTETLIGPFLEHHPEQGGPAERVPVRALPFTLGRAENHDRIVYSNGVSRDHAEILRIGSQYAIRDLGSTNGTFLNGRRITQAWLNDGDILHLAHVEFCFHCDTTAAPAAPALDDSVLSTLALPFGQPDSLIRGARLIRELIDTESARILYQPIVDLRTRAVIAYEALGRGTHPDLSQKPAELLQLAASCHLAVELSQVFRAMAVRGASRLRGGSTVFLNVHPAELVSPSFITSLEALERPPCGTYRFVLEIAEACVTDVAAMATHREAFSALDFEFAYDDFGAGQARLLELCDIPPHYLKLDAGVVQGIEGVKARQEVVRALLSVIGSLGVQIVAEGIETEPVALMCQELGCQLGQGYLFGRPM